MKTLLTAAILMTALVTVQSGQEKNPRPVLAERVAWEYKVETDLDERRLNILGSQGWELVIIDSSAVRAVTKNGTLPPVASYVPVTYYYLKRPRN